jgi:TolA-binding protein
LLDKYFVKPDFHNFKFTRPAGEFFSPMAMRLLVILFIALASLPAVAASSTEKRAWEADLKHFEDAKSPLLWAMVETNFSQFIKKFPDSEHYADAVVFESRALYEQGKYDAVISLLSSQTNRGSGVADQFDYWTAKSYAKKQNYQQSADTFARLVRENPNSPLRLEAIFREAEAHAKLESWPKVIEELREPSSLFQQFARTNQSDELVVSGLLLLSEAELAQKDYAAAGKTLQGIATEHLRPELEWERQFLLCRVQMADGQAQAALEASTNLLMVAEAANRPELKAKSFFLQGQIHEQLDDMPSAVRSYEINLTNDLPAVRRQALLRIVDLNLRQNQTADAAQKLSDFLKDNPKTADFELLVLGELRLKEYFQPTNNASVINPLQSAETNFETIIRNFPNSEYLGKAELNLAWCLDAQGRTAESQAAFGRAGDLLPFSEDQAVARFKLADTLYQQKDFSGAVANYRLVIEKYDSLPAVKNELFEPALYQMVQASLSQSNLAVATEAMNKMLELFPNGSLADDSLLLVGQAETPAKARELFSRFLTQYPNSDLLPEMKLAMARTYESEANWMEAINLYDKWVQTYTNDPALPRAEFSRASANYRAALAANTPETNAFYLFTSFVTQFATNPVALSNDLPARAQHWVGDYYWRQEDFQKAELSYKEIFSDWPKSSLALEARMMAGRAALANQSPQAAISYFTNLISLSNCPPTVIAQALFASGDAALALPPATTPGKYQNAIYFFRLVVDTYTNTPIAIRAWGRLGDCYFALPENQMSQYETASNAFTLIINANAALADATTRSMAEIRLGQTLEAMSRLPGAADPKGLTLQALKHFMNVLYGSNLRDTEQADLIWVKEAGLDAGKLAEDLGENAQAVQFYERLISIAPPLRATLEKKIAKLQESQSASAKN